MLEGNLQFGNFISRKKGVVTGGNKWVPGEPLLVEKHPERLDTGHQHVHPQVELQPVDQQRLLQVSLHAQGTLFHWHVLEVIDHFYAHPAEEVGRFDDPEAVLGSLHGPPEEVALAGQDVGVGHVAPLIFAKLLAHPCVVLKQKLFYVRRNLLNYLNAILLFYVNYLTTSMQTFQLHFMQINVSCV